MHSEIYEAGRWHADKKYNAPTASNGEHQVFVGDIVTCQGVNEYPVVYAKILRFVKVVC